MGSFLAVVLEKSESAVCRGGSDVPVCIRGDCRRTVTIMKLRHGETYQPRADSTTAARVDELVAATAEARRIRAARHHSTPQMFNCPPVAYTPAAPACVPRTTPKPPTNLTEHRHREHEKRVASIAMAEQGKTITPISGCDTQLCKGDWRHMKDEAGEEWDGGAVDRDCWRNRAHYVVARATALLRGTVLGEAAR